jgi:hypothetical protein
VLFALLAAADARAQSVTTSPLQPSLTDPRHAQQFESDSAPEGLRAPEPERIAAPPRSGVGDTGFDSTGETAKSKNKKKQARRKPGAPHPAPSRPPAPPGPPQRSGGRAAAPQFAVRATYAEAYRPPDAPQRRSMPSNADAFEPLGLRLGSFVVRPSIDVTRGYNSNPAHSQNGSGSYFATAETALQLRSDWSRHSYGADLRGSFTRYDTERDLNQPQVDIKTFSRFDIARDTRIDTESRFYLSTDYPGSPNLQAGIARLPIYYTYGSSVGLTRSFNRLELTAKGSIDQFRYNDSQLTDGTTASNRDRDFDQYVGQLRASYQATPGVKPFVEIAADMRQHELPIDRNNLRRDSRALTPKLGTTFELTRKLTGEIGVGYLMRRFEDATLPDMRGVIADASLVWTASALTTATLSATSRAEESVLPGVSGALRRDAGLKVEHAFRRWLIGTVTLGYGLDQYVGSPREDTRTSLGAAITYKFNRDLWLKGEVRRDSLRSNEPGSDYDANVVMFGLKLQR